MQGELVTIWKYALPPGEEVEITMPRGAEILDFQSVHNDTSAALWALVDPHAEAEVRRFHVIQTGEWLRREELEGMRYLGSSLLMASRVHLHLFERAQQRSRVSPA